MRSTELARELVLRRVAAAISAATVWRTLAKDAIRPWYHRMWIFPRDPAFAAKAGRVLDLYARLFEGQALGVNEFVICADEKDEYPGKVPLPPELAAREGPALACRARVRMQRGCRLYGHL
jgi:hypothetical protein